MRWGWSSCASARATAPCWRTWWPARRRASLLLGIAAVHPRLEPGRHPHLDLVEVAQPRRVGGVVAEHVLLAQLAQQPRQGGPHLLDALDLVDSPAALLDRLLQELDLLLVIRGVAPDGEAPHRPHVLLLGPPQAQPVERRLVAGGDLPHAVHRQHAVD